MMKFYNFRKIISLILTVGILFSIFSICASAEQKSEDNIQKSYYYNDEYFTKSSNEYDEHLATMTLNLELTTFSDSAETVLTGMMKELGFDSIVTDDLDKEPAKDTIGSGIGFKKLGDYNLIAVVLRGGNYGREWASNFLVGKEGNAKGFDDASKKVLERLSNYINDNKLSNNKIWVTGYSRGGAVANLAGVNINENLSTYSTTAEDLFVYTFEAPAGCASDKVYNNIYNIVNVNDPVPFLYPKAWNLYSNGKRIEIGADEKIMTYTLYDDYKEKTKNEFFEEFFVWFTGQISREEYVDQLENTVSMIADVFFSKTPEERQKIINYIASTIQKNVVFDPKNQMDLINSFSDIVNKKSDCLYRDLADKIVKILESSRAYDKDKTISDLEFAVIKNMVHPLVKTIAPILVADYIYYEGIDYDEYYKKVNPLYNMSDYDWGYKEGSEEGKYIGYCDGLDENITEMKMTLDHPFKYSDEYMKGFNDGLTSAYPEGFNLGKKHLTDTAAKGDFDGTNDAVDDGYYDAFLGREKNPKPDDNLVYQNEEKWCTEEYKEAYKKSYLKSYDENYEKGLEAKKEKENKPQTLSLYHTMTIIKNKSEIVADHYPEINLELLKKADSYYNAEPKNPNRNGDLDNDNLITSNDALLILRNSVGLEEFDDNQKKLADVDQDNIITSADSLIVLRASVKIYDSPEKEKFFNP